MKKTCEHQRESSKMSQMAMKEDEQQNRARRKRQQEGVRRIQKWQQMKERKFGSQTEVKQGR